MHRCHGGGITGCTGSPVTGAFGMQNHSMIAAPSAAVSSVDCPQAVEAVLDWNSGVVSSNCKLQVPIAMRMEPLCGCRQERRRHCFITSSIPRGSIAMHRSSSLVKARPAPPARTCHRGTVRTGPASTRRVQHPLNNYGPQVVAAQGATLWRPQLQLY